MIEESELYEHHRFMVDKGQSFLRIDKYLDSKIPGISRNRIQQGLKTNCILVNNIPVKVSYRVKPGDEIVILLPETPPDKTVNPEKIPLDIVYEDKYLIVINKKAGLLVHPTFNQFSGTLWNGLLYYFQENDYPDSPYLLHRLDRDTSGLLMIAKDKSTAEKSFQQFYLHQVKRIYFSIIWGKVSDKSGTIDLPLMKNRQNNRMEVHKDGKRAVTHYKLIEYFNDFSLISCELETGRTHQIRAHFSYLGYPLFNDPLYGGQKGEYSEISELLPGQALHAAKLEFCHPLDNNFIHLKAELPENFKKMIDYLKSIKK